MPTRLPAQDSLPPTAHPAAICLAAQQEQESGELRCTLCLEGLQASGRTGSRTDLCVVCCHVLCGWHS